MKGKKYLGARGDDVVPFEDSRQLILMSRLPKTALIQIGRDHRLADPEPLAALLPAVEWA